MFLLSVFDDDSFAPAAEPDHFIFSQEFVKRVIGYGNDGKEIIINCSS